MKILVAYDGSDSANAAIDDLGTAGLPDTGDGVVLSVTENWLPPPSAVEILEEVTREMESRSLAQGAAVQIKSQLPGWNVTAEASLGAPATRILDRADELQADLIVLGSHGRSALGRFLLGSISQRVLLEAKCSVRVARGRVQEPETALRVMIGVDGSVFSDAAVEAVASRHWPAGTEVRLVNANSPLPIARQEETMSRLSEWIHRENKRVREKVDAAMVRLRKAGLTVSAFSKEVEPVKLLLAEAEKWGADSIFLGARGMGPVERFLIGSVSSSVAARAHCSVEIVRGD